MLIAIGQGLLRDLQAGYLVAMIAAALATAAIADPNPCDVAARNAARESGVSLALLRAIMLAETGRNLGQGPEPWPWTLHAEGQGHWLASRDEARALAEDLMAQGKSNIDIGCFQINLHWHGDAFASLDAMLDPQANANYAAHYLQDLYAQTGDWRSAAGAYHSRDASRAETYVARLVAMHAETAGIPAQSNAEQGDATYAEASAPVRRPVTEPGGPIVVLGSLAAPLIGGLR